MGKRIVALVNPPMVGLNGDVLGSNIPYMPIQLAYLASYLESKGYSPLVIDGFGFFPGKRAIYKGRYERIGLSVDEIVDLLPASPAAVCIYAGLVTNHSLVLELISKTKGKNKAPVVVFENSLAVTGYSLAEVKGRFFEAGADYLVFGEPEERVASLIKALEKKSRPKLDGIACMRGGKIISNEACSSIKDLDSLPFPAYDLLPLEKYWGLGYSHGPFSGKFVPLITSRGCPYNCNFCVVPGTNKGMWRARSPKNVVNEIEHWKKKLEVADFQVEDLNPTMDKKRTIGICKEILARNLEITWKIAAGTKAESLGDEVLEWMRKAGCVYLSISPETGSQRLLKLMNKPFNHEHGLKIVGKCAELGIVTQCCFVIGYPGETEGDLKLTRDYIGKLAQAGADEIAVFIMAPLPGSKVFGEFEVNDLDALDFTSEWREDYGELEKTRRKLYKHFIMKRLIAHPLELFSEGFRSLTGKSRTKMGMAARRWIAIRK